MGGFEGDGAEVAKASVPTVRVVPRCDRGEDRLDHVGTRGPGAQVDELDLQGFKEGVSDRVVQACARPPLGAGGAGLSQQCLEGPGGVGAATVGMMDKFLARYRSPAVRGTWCVRLDKSCSGKVDRVARTRSHIHRATCQSAYAPTV